MDTFQNYYQINIAPKLKKIDLFFKTEDYKTAPITVDVISELLDLDAEEIQSILKKHHLKEVTKINFFLIMRDGSSDICKLFRRQLSTGLNDTYTPQEIAYIYEIPEDIINKAMFESGLHTISVQNLDQLFSYIYIEA